MSVDLRRNAVMSVSTSVSCQRGLLWVTRAGDRNDYLLRPGERLEGPGRLVVQALRDSEMIVAVG